MKRNGAQQRFFDWKGSRGEWFVVIQGLLFGVVVFAPSNLPSWTPWPFPWALLATTMGVFFLAAGGWLALAGMFRLGANLTPLPYPKTGSQLVQTGPYRFVRHPIYSGVILTALGWALWVHGALTLGYTLILLVFFDIKSRQEERWLREKFTGYGTYQKRVRKLIPFIY